MFILADTTGPPKFDIFITSLWIWIRLFHRDTGYGIRMSRNIWNNRTRLKASCFSDILPRATYYKFSWHIPSHAIMRVILLYFILWFAMLLINLLSVSFHHQFLKCYTISLQRDSLSVLCQCHYNFLSSDENWSEGSFHQSSLHYSWLMRKHYCPYSLVAL